MSAQPSQHECTKLKGEPYERHEKNFNTLFSKKVGWPTFSLVLMLAGGVIGWTVHEVSAVREAQAAIVTRVSVIEANAGAYREEMKAVNAKLDRLLYMRGAEDGRSH